MPDGVVLVKQAVDGDRAIDNVVVTNELDEVVYRQRVEVADLDTIVGKLNDIFGAVDGLEVTTDQISVDAGTINLSTDQLETLIAAVRDRLPAALDADGGAKVHVQNLPATQPVSGTFWQATQPVSGTVTVANPTTNPETGLAKDATLLRRYGDHVTKAGLANTIGDNTLHTPAAGKRIRLYWIGLSTSQDNVAENLIQIKLTDADGTVKYRWRMGNPGAFVGGRTIEGNADEPLILNLATTDGVDWNVDLEEVT
jgi:outer membrane murein-binding lipoprotein Lpp